LGKFISENLLESGLKVYVLYRGGSLQGDKLKVAEILRDKGAELIEVNYTDRPALVAAFKGKDVVVSALSLDGVYQQEDLVHAAKSAGIKFFIPSEFAGDSSVIREGMSSYFDGKRKVAKLLTELGINYTLVYMGFFHYIVSSTFFGFGLDKENEQFNVLGDGSQKLAFTSAEDTGKLVAKIVTDPNPPQQVYFYVSRHSFNEIKELWEHHFGKKFQQKSTGDIKEWEKIAKEKKPLGLMASIGPEYNVAILTPGYADFQKNVDYELKGTTTITEYINNFPKN